MKIDVPYRLTSAFYDRLIAIAGVLSNTEYIFDVDGDDILLYNTSVPLHSKHGLLGRRTMTSYPCVGRLDVGGELTISMFTCPPDRVFEIISLAKQVSAVFPGNHQIRISDSLYLNFEKTSIPAQKAAAIQAAALDAVKENVAKAKLLLE